MNYDEVLNILNMKKRIQQAKALHPYEIHCTEKSGYFTKVDDDTQPTGKRKFRRSTEESLWDVLAVWYLDNKHNLSFTQLYEEWISWKETPQNQDNIKRIKASWNAYYEKEPLSKDLIEMPVSKITSRILREWAEAILKKNYPVDKKKFSRIFSIVNQCLEYASDEEQVFTDEERRQLKVMIREDLTRYKKQPTVAGLQILFLFETPLTKEARKILEEVTEYNKTHGLNAEWIFQGDNPKYDYRLSYNAADRKLRKLCKRLDTVIKSPHKCRKTCISTLLDNPNVNNRTVQRFAGHKDLTTTFGYYNFDRKSKEEQAEAIDHALAI